MPVIFKLVRAVCPTGFFKFPLTALGVAYVVVSAANAAPDLLRKNELAAQRVQYDAVEKKSVIDIQLFRHAQSRHLQDDRSVRLTNLNPNINSWYLLDVSDPAGRVVGRFHLENPFPKTQKISLTATGPAALVIETPAGQSSCSPWLGDLSGFYLARKAGLAFAPLCNGSLYLRNRVFGSRTSLERTSEFLRDHVWKGENIVGFVKSTFFKDSEMESGAVLGAQAEQVDNSPLGEVALNEKLQSRPVIATWQKLDLVGPKFGRMALGKWYSVKNLDGVYASAMQPWALDHETLTRRGNARYLDGVEMRATSYMVAFDLTKFDMGYETGTDHPRLEWSPRPPAASRNWHLPGPDGFSSSAPLVTLGMVNPTSARRTIATFTGGFKRRHSAFRGGKYALQNSGTHYGFVVEGIILSKLQPGLSTLFVLNDGSIHMKTWHETDNALLAKIRFARQNGVPLIETNPDTGLGETGALVSKWLPGNWSGSAEAKLRTLRAGACMRTVAGRQFLIYGYFSTATPSAMARVFEGYGCQYAMLLDMNALEHTYLSLLVRKQNAIQVEHLMGGMAAVDKRLRNGTTLPRFVGFADNRDFFYLMRKTQ